MADVSRWTNDITGIFITLNRTPKRWSDYHMAVLKEAIREMPIISISKVPMDFGENYLDTDVPGYVNIYRQLLRGTRLAKTKYVAMIEDDCLYSQNHFVRFRPKDDEFAYNRNRWSVFTWGEPQYSLRQRISNCSLIAPKELLIEALTERFKKCGENPPEDKMGECGRNKLEKALGITLRKQVDFFSNISIIQLSHPLGTEKRQQEQWKSHAEIRAFDIPFWGRAENIVGKYK